MKNRKKDDMSFYKKALLILGGLVILLVGINIYSANYETTSDAVVEGRLVTVAPKVSGFVTHIYVEDGLEVKKGDLLMEIDYSVYIDKLRKAESELKVARTKLAMAYYDPETGARRPNRFLDKIRFPHSGFDNFTSKFGAGIDTDPDEDRGFSFKYDKSVLTDQTKNPPKEKPKALPKDAPAKVAEGVQNPNNQNMNGENEEEELDPKELAREVKRLEAIVEQLKLDLSYTKVYATQDGTISSCRVHVGEMADVGQGVISIIPKRVWITAKYSSLQAEKMVIGQPVVIRTTKYPARSFKGVVEDIKRTPESEWVMPAGGMTSELRQNTDGKVAVKISFIEDYSDYNFTPGMKVTALVKIK